MKEKLKTFKVWVHVDSGYEIKVKAKDEEVLKYFEAKRKRFLDFLDLAKKERRSIQTSV